MSPTSPATGDAHELVLEAFRRARASGKPDWDRMRTAVLKNRLLDITQRKFDESDWGAGSFREFVEGLGDLVAIDAASTPVVLVLQPQAKALLAESEEEITPPSGRVRADLWHAILDYTSTDGWAWDNETRTGVPSEESSDGAPLLPTVTPEELRGWRDDFVRASPDAFTELAGESMVERWREGLGGAEQLPPRLRHRWFEFLKSRVVERLTIWFSDHHIAPPADLVRSVPAPRQRSDEHHQLREFVMACVREMSAEELAALPVPARAAWRAGRRP